MKNQIAKSTYPLLSLALILFLSCNNQPKPVQKATNTETIKYDSTYFAERNKKAIIRADSIFTGFMGLKWYSKLDEAKKYFRTSKELKIKYVVDNILYLSGSYAGGQVKDLALTFYNDKLSDVWVDFGYKSDVFYNTLKESLVKKYGEPFNLTNGCVWNFNISDSEKYKPKINLSNDREGVSLLYISKYCDKYKDEVELVNRNKEKETLKSKQKDL